MQARAFNSINIDHKQGLFTKSSFNVAKLKDEINYYLSLPKIIALYFPQLVDYKKDFTAYTMEYIPYSNFSELIHSHQISLQEGKAVLEKLLHMLDKLHACKTTSQKNCQSIQDFYIKKTITRVDDLAKNPEFDCLTKQNSVTINGKSYRTFAALQDHFIKAIRSTINEETTVSVIHGDFCFSNILYHPNTQDIKLIDPRGSFIAAGVYGDTSYDYAKIMHCLHGRYDCMVKGDFTLDETEPGHFVFTKPSFKLVEELHNHYKKLLQQRGINVKFLYLIEASLFLSMSVLHYEDKLRQKALFLTGLMILNDFFENKNENLH